MINYADEAARHVDLERQQSIAFTWRTQLLLERAKRELDRRIRHYPKYYRSHYDQILEQLHLDLCREDLIWQQIIADQTYYRSRAQMFSAEALRLGHIGTGRVYAS